MSSANRPNFSRPFRPPGQISIPFLFPLNGPPLHVNPPDFVCTGPSGWEPASIRLFEI